MYKTIEINRSKLTIMGIKFSDLETLESTANAIGSNMKGTINSDVNILTDLIFELIG